MPLKYLRDVASVTIDVGKCNGCGQCQEVCPHRVLTLENRRATVVDRDACMECGACQRNCPQDAIRVEAGVGCAYAILNGMLRGTPPECSCGGDESGPAECC